MARKKSLIDDISMAMGCTAETMPNVQHVVSDETILQKITALPEVNHQDRIGRTVLMLAAIHGRTAVARYLLAHGANVREQDANRFTALHFAVQAGNVDIARLLLNAGADVNARDRFGNGPILRCNRATPQELYRLLLSRGADAYQKNDYGMATADVFADQPEVMALIQEYAKT